MDSSKDTKPDNGNNDRSSGGGEQEHAGGSGEGAASALAHLKTQNRQHRHQAGDQDDPSGGPVR